MKKIKFTLIILSFLCVSHAAPNLGFKRYSPTLTKLLQEILRDYFPVCDLILIQDAHFASNMNGWMSSMKNPYYSLTLDGRPFPDYTTWQKITKTTGFLCSTIVVTCLTYKSCRIPDSLILYSMLSANGILLKERRTLLYIEEEKYDNTTVPYLTSYQEPGALKYTIPSMNEAKRILDELKSHITIIHELGENYGLVNGRKTSNVRFETVTFTPNWFPGGTPVLKSTWSVKYGFLVPPSFIVNLTLARPGGIATFCVSSKHSLPSIDIAANGDIHGLDGELIKVFQRRFNFRLNFFEPRDQDFGSKGPTGEWTGVIGYLIRKEADFGVGQLTLTLERFETGLKFSQTLRVLTAVVVCPLPKTLPRYEILMYPFDNSTWIAILGATAIFVIIFEMMQRIVCKMFGIKFTVGRKTIFLKLRRQRMLPWIQSLGPVFLRSIPVQGIPRRWGILGLFSVWLIFTFIVNAHYTTILIGALTIFPREPFLVSPLDLLEGQRTWAVSPIVNQTLSNSSHLIERLLLKGATPIPESDYNNGPLDTKVYSYVNATGNCGLAESTRSKYYLSKNFTVRIRNHEYTKVYLSRDSILIGPMGWAYREDMDFLVESYLDNVFLQFRSYGFIIKYVGIWKTQDQIDRSNTIQPLSMATLEPVFVIAGYFIAISLVVFLLEIVTYKSLLQLPK